VSNIVHILCYKEEFFLLNYIYTHVYCMWQISWLHKPQRRTFRL